PSDYNAAVSVSLDTPTAGATIYYTTDGTDPTPATASVYTGAIQVDSTMTLKAMATLKDWADSDVAGGLYTITIVKAVAPPPPPPPQVPAISQSEIDDARGALARAKEAGADYYDATNYDAARRLLDDGIALSTKDPATARDRLANATKTANLAFDNSVSRAAADLSARMQAAKQRLLDLEADKWVADDYQRATGLIDDAQSLYASNDLAGARAKAYDALRAMTNLRNQLATRLTNVRALKNQVEDVMKQAEEAQAGTYAPDQRQNLNNLYLQGLSAFQGYKIDAAEESFGSALQAGRDAVTLARQNRDAQQAAQKQKADELQVQVMKALEDASKLTVVTEDGTVHQPQNWSEDDFLKEIDQMIQQEQPAAPSSGGNQSLVIPSDGGTVVLADDQQVDLLKQARDLWSQGLKAKADGDYVQAQQYFNEALRYIAVYKSYAVKGVYTVRLIPDRRDCLWRISEYKEIYGDPYLWPVIWRRNRKLIQNPDLIYPGWQLVIPPQ
ncbi:MAG TPA: chitobiase/beta-hexosaminidase C-terminal domain-containing protein, partial [Spirochaetia bacterium]|nr:chitobiase/beta-hexosaminidase C-terminal domain-containing protein [Spirochaetia bacterium]